MLAGILFFFYDGLSTGKWLGDLLALISGIFYAGVFMLNSFENGDALSSVAVFATSDRAAPALRLRLAFGGLPDGLAPLVAGPGAADIRYRGIEPRDVERAARAAVLATPITNPSHNTCL